MEQALALQAPHIDLVMFSKAIALLRDCASTRQLGLNPTHDFFFFLSICPIVHPSGGSHGDPGPSVSLGMVWGCATRPLLSRKHSHQPAPYLHFSMTVSASLSFLCTRILHGAFSVPRALKSSRSGPPASLMSTKHCSIFTEPSPYPEHRDPWSQSPSPVLSLLPRPPRTHFRFLEETV